MPRKSYKELAKSYAEPRGIELTEEPSRDFGIEIWGATSHWGFETDSHSSEYHTHIVYVNDTYDDQGKMIRTEPQLWKYIYALIQEMQECPKTCDCYRD